MNPRVLLAFLAFSLAHVLVVAAEPPQVEQWGRFELNLTGPASGNPFLEVELNARFTQGNTTINVTGFYDGEGQYRVRFMPEKIGEWRYITHSLSLIHI